MTQPLEPTGMNDTPSEELYITINIEPGLLPELRRELAPFVTGHAGVEVHLGEAPIPVYSPEYVEWVEGKDTHGLVPIVSTEMLSQFALQRHGKTNAGSRLKYCLASPKDDRTVLKPFTVLSEDGNLSLGFYADRLVQLWENLHVRKIQVHKVGDSSIDLLKEYCDEMLIKPAQAA